MNRRSMLKALMAFTAILSFRAIGKTKRKSAPILQRCVGCGDCSRVCPTDAITIIKGKSIVNSDKCIGCFLCSAACTYGAIERWEKEE